MRNYKFSLMTGMLFSLSLSVVFAQPGENQNSKPPKKSFWFDMGFGWGGQGNAFNTGFSYQIKPAGFLSIHYAEALSDKFCNETVFIIPVKNRFGKSGRSVDLSYGFLKKGKVSLMNFSAGLSYVSVETGEGSGRSTTPGFPLIYTTDCPDNFTSKEEGTVGLALRAQFIPSLPWGGIGISPYLNINPKYTFGSFTITVAFGRIRPRIS